MQRILSTPDRPSGPLLDEKDKKTNAAKCSKPNEMHVPTNHPQVSSLQSGRIVLSTPDRPSGPLLEERNLKSTNRASSNVPPMKNIQARDNIVNQVFRQFLLNSDESNRRIVITDEFHQASVFERLGTQSTPSALELQLRGDRVILAKPKPPNYSRINSTIKLCQPTAYSTSQQSKSITSCASAVKSNLNFNLNIMPQSTIKSTSDLPHQTTTEPKVPFKLTPILPPKKIAVINSITSTSVPNKSSKTTNISRTKLKSKIRSLATRALSPVPEIIASNINVSEDNQVQCLTTVPISSQPLTAFDMINECDLPMLTDDAEEATIVPNNAISSQEIRESIAEAMLVDNETNESIIKSSSKLGLSTPDRPSGPLLEEMPPIHVATEIDQPIEIYQINIDKPTMHMAEIAVVIKTRITSNEINNPQQSNPLASLQYNNFDGVVGLTNINSTSEPCLSDHSPQLAKKCYNVGRSKRTRAIRIRIT